ncbi:ribosome biogenesis [Vairimorpha ceranae]|uniref:Ribosome biogenesis n=1 Tax=Vairimorpha ceranae TaxID=40302 RepID=A0A0F9ZFX7_9MICR|nr:ribosome biogenesis [Vairimorpha ceranae]KKO76274.1 ribosome biogenesis [Vairimorpha ceranae]
MTVLILSSRGSSSQTRYLIKDICKFIKCEEESKYDIKQNIRALVDLVDLHKCESIIYFETTKRNERVWFGLRHGISIKFNVLNLYTMKNLKFAVNCFKDCGHVLMFSEDFDKIDFLVSIKKVFTEVFKSNEIKDRALCFYWLDDKIWIRNYVIDGNDMKEIGPRLVLEVDKILENCFSGSVLYSKKVEDARNKYQESINHKL